MKLVNVLLVVFLLLLFPNLYSQSPCGGGPEDGCFGCGGSSEPGNNGGGKEIRIPVLHAFDPNDITGEIGYDTAQWVSIKDQLGYTIRFENDPDFATAPAQIVRISCPIDSHLNINSLRLGSFGFGSFIFEVPENTSFYAKRLDVTDSLNVFVDVTAGIDITKNEAFWIFESIDPLTGLAPENALIGFLPVNDTTVTIYTDTLVQKGEGFVNFTIFPDGASMTGDTVREQASIIFDDNSPIETNIWVNLIDALPPSSEMAMLPDNVPTDTITLTWTAIDDPGGVGDELYDLYVSKDGGQYFLFASNIDTTQFLFQGDIGSEYAFYIRAIDYVGNKEAQKFVEDEKTVLGNDPCEIDMVAPVAACAGNQMITLDNFGEATLNATNLDGGSTDNCDLPLSFSLSKSSFGCADVGTNTIDFIVTDAAGNRDTCRIEVEVIDDLGNCDCQEAFLTIDEDPISEGLYKAARTLSSSGRVASEDKVYFSAQRSITLKSGFIAELGSNFSAKIEACNELDGIAILSPANGSTICTDGDIAIEWDVFGAVNRVDIILAESSDFSNPITIATNLNLNQSPFNYNAFDNLSPYETYYVKVRQANINNGVEAISSFALGFNTYEEIEEIVCDANLVGQTEQLLTSSLGCDSTVVTNFVLDTLPPAIMCKSGVELALDNFGEATLDISDIDDSTFDDCTPLSLSLDKTSFGCKELGSQSVTLTATDARGNTATCTTTIQVTGLLEICDCQDINLVLDNRPIDPGLYKAANSITSKGSVTTGSRVTFKAQRSVILKEGFIAEQGSQFRASIDECVEQNGIEIINPMFLSNYCEGETIGDFSS